MPKTTRSNKPVYRLKASKPLTAAEKMRAYRARKKKAGYKLAQAWVPDIESSADRVRKKLKKQGITQRDVSDAVSWARERPGYKLVQMWVLDLEDPKIRRQVRRELKAMAGSKDEEETLAFIAAAADLSGWK